MADSLSLQSIVQLGAVQAVNSLSAPAAVNNQGGGAESFGNVLTKTAEKTPADTKVEASAKPKNDTPDRGRIENGDSGKAKEDVGNTQNDTVRASDSGRKGGEVTEETKNAVKDAAETVKEEIKEELNVSEEDIVNAMETLGLTLLDLLKGENIASLTAELTGNDISVVVADEAVYGNVENILSVQREVTGELLQELDLTMDELKEAIDNGSFEVGTGNTVIPEETVITPDSEMRPETESTAFRTILENTESKETVITSREETAGTPAETVNTLKEAQEPDRQPERRVEVVMEKVSESTAEAGDRVTVASSVPEETEEGTKGNSKEKDTGAFQRSMGHAPEGHAPGVILQTENPMEFTDNLTEAVSQTTSEVIESYERIRDIMNQVRDQIRISVNQETTTMEMQLNPESLGKVGLHIESKAGNVTAQFFAQDESVRAALETQVAELRRNLEEQGIKVESVEVTLASREFESNFLNDQSGNGDTPDREEAERAARLRRINFGAGGAEDIPEEEMTEDEILNARIMRERGGTVDFTA